MNKNVFAERRVGARETGKNDYDLIMNGFPPKERRWEAGRAVCDPYWKILTKRRSLRYDCTGLSADINSFARRMA